MAGEYRMVPLKDGDVVLNDKGQYVVEGDRLIPLYEIFKPKKSLLEEYMGSVAKITYNPTNQEVTHDT